MKKPRITAAFLNKYYSTRGQSAAKIAKTLGLTENQVLYWLKKHGIPTKNNNRQYLIKDLTNKQFGDYTVIRQVFNHGTKAKGAVWECRCKCGNIRNVQGGHLRTATSLSCGCWSTKGNGVISGSYLSVLRHNAAARGHIFDIDIDYISQLLIKQQYKCAISGVKIISILDSTKRTTQTASLDRIDPTQGYVQGNVQWVHKDVNKMKHVLTQDIFLDWVKKIYEHTQANS